MIKVESNNGRCILSRLYSTYPIKLIRQNEWLTEQYISIVILGYGGGLVQGDKTCIDIIVDNHAKLCLKTQASTKIYKSLHTNQISINCLKATVNSNSMLMYIPDPTTCYSKSRYQQSYHIELYDKTSSLLFVDWFTSGRQNRDKKWDQHYIQNEITIKMKHHYIYVENTTLENNHYGDIDTKLNHFTVYGSIIMIGKETKLLQKRLDALTCRESFNEYKANKLNDQHQQDYVVDQDNDSKGNKRKFKDKTHSGNHESFHYIPNIVSVADLGHQCSVVRFAYHSVEECYEFLYELLQPIHKEWNGCYPYLDRLHKTSASANRSTSTSCGITACNTTNTDTTSTTSTTSIPSHNTDENNYNLLHADIYVQLLRKYDDDNLHVIEK